MHAHRVSRVEAGKNGARLSCQTATA
jgi:hypothetical protein